MSIIATVYVSEGIVMAADSRVTGTTTNITNQVTTIDRHTVSDSSQKLFLIGKKIGLSCCGDAEINGKPITEFVREFDIECCSDFPSVEETAKRLSAFTKIKGNNAFVIYHVSGYDNGVQEVYRVYNESVKRMNEMYGATWDGEGAILSNLVSGKVPLNLDLNHMYLKDAIEFADFMIDVTCKTQRFSSDVATCGGPIDILLITKDYSKWIRHKILNP